MYLSDIDKPWACSGEDTGQLRIMYHNGGIMDNQGPNKYNYNNGNNGGNGGRNSGGNRIVSHPMGAVKVLREPGSEAAAETGAFRTPWVR